MIGFKNIQIIADLLTNFLAYLFTVAPAGYFQAWVAKKMGDYTAENMGYLTLNPLPQIDFFGLLCLLFAHFGWGKSIPINPNNIVGNYRLLKLACAFFSGAFAHFVLAILAICASSCMVNNSFAAQDLSSSLLIFKLLLAFVGLNMGLTFLRLISAVYFIASYFSKNNSFSPAFFYITILAPVIVLFLFGNELQQWVVNGIVNSSKILKSLIS